MILMAILSLSAVAQTEPVQTASDMGLKGPVKRVSEVMYGYDGELGIHCMEFDEQGRLSRVNNSCYVYDDAGRLVLADGKYYSYDENGLLLCEQMCNKETKVRYVYKYQYTKERLTSCAFFRIDSVGGKTVLWNKTYQYDKRGRLLGAEAKTVDNKKSRVLFSYRVLYAADGTPKNYLWSHEEGPWYDEYGELLKAAEVVTDTLPCDEWTFYIINHNYEFNHKDNAVVPWNQFDEHGNGTARYKYDTASVYDEYGEKIADTIFMAQLTRTLEYYGEYDVNVSVIEQDVLYNGLENPVRISVQGVPDEFVFVGDEEDSTYTTFRDENRKGNHYYIVPQKMGRLDLPIKVIVDGKMKKVGKYTFRVRSIPVPKLFLGKYESGSAIPVEEFKSMKGVDVRYGEDFVFRMKRPKVVGQNITITKVPGADDLYNRTSQWSPDIVVYVYKSKADSKVCIDVEVDMPDGTKRTIAGQWYLVK